MSENRYILSKTPLNGKERFYQNQRRELLLKDNVELVNKLKTLQGKVYDQSIHRMIHKLLLVLSNVPVEKQKITLKSQTIGERGN